MKIFTEHNGIYRFLKSNYHLFKKPNRKYREDMKFISQFHSIEYPYGKCFPSSQFLFYLLGGYKGDYHLRCIRKIPMEIGGRTFFTSHWFVQANDNSHIIDLTKDQFNGILDIEEYYPKSKRAAFGFPYVKKEGRRFENCVPCKEVIKIYAEWRKINGVSEPFETYYQELMKYEG